MRFMVGPQVVSSVLSNGVASATASGRDGLGLAIYVIAKGPRGKISVSSGGRTEPAPKTSRASRSACEAW